jgi:hypothetical protein
MHSHITNIEFNKAASINRAGDSQEPPVPGISLGQGILSWHWGCNVQWFNSTAALHTILTLSLPAMLLYIP